MARPTLEEIAGAIRDRVPEARERAKEAARDLADRGRIAGLEIRRRVRRAERIGRENAFLMAAVALGTGLAIGWILGKSRD